MVEAHVKHKVVKLSLLFKLIQIEKIIDHSILKRRKFDSSDIKQRQTCDFSGFFPSIDKKKKFQIRKSLLGRLSTDDVTYQQVLPPHAATYKKWFVFKSRLPE